MSRALPLVLLLFLSACSLFSSRADRALRASPDYKAGYSDGCGTASTQGANPRDDGMARDDESYRTNKPYRAGWNTGFNACRVSQSPSGPAGEPDRSLTADPTPNGMP